MAEQESRTQAATPTRLGKAVDESGAPVSREVTTLGVLGTAFLVMVALIPAATRHLVGVLAYMVGHAEEGDMGAQGLWAAIAAGEVVLPVAGAVAAAAILFTLLQTGIRINRAAIGFNFARLSPLTGLSTVFGMQHMMTTAQSLLKIAGLGAALCVVVPGRMRQVADLLSAPVTHMPPTIFGGLMAILGVGVLIQTAIGAADFGLTRMRFATRLRMSTEEVKDEQKEVEGNPEIKARLKAVRMALAKRGLKAAMARATVIVTNPTHYAVALEYHAGQAEAPRVVAKGADDRAARIREMAKSARIPIVSNPPLARALFRQEVDTEIRPEHYRAVAEVIAYIWKLAERQRPAAITAADGR